MGTANLDGQRGLATGFLLAEWVVKPEDGSLTSSTTSQRLEPLLMDLLVFLCSRAGQVVSKQELLDAVWEGRFVSDDTIKGSFYQLRKALGDNPRQPQFVETVPKRGYRMLVQPLPVQAESENGPDRVPGDARLAPVRKQSSSRLAILVGTAFVLVALVGWLGHLRNSSLEPRKIQAQEWYQEGRKILSNYPNAASLNQAGLYFERSTDLDPENAEVISALGYTYALRVGSGIGGGRDWLSRARANANRALELNPKLCEPHVTLGAVYFLLDHDAKSAEKEFQYAVKLARGNSRAHLWWYAYFLSSQGRHEEAITEARRALAMDPLSLFSRHALIEILFMARRFDEAIAEAHKALASTPAPADLQLGLVMMYHMQNKDPEAFQWFMAGLKSRGVAQPLIEQAQKAFEQKGLTAVMRLWAERLEREASLGQPAQYELLTLHAALGDKDRCFELLEVARQEEHMYVIWVPVSPLFEGLRSDPRYATFISTLGFKNTG